MIGSLFHQSIDSMVQRGNRQLPLNDAARLDSMLPSARREPLGRATSSGPELVAGSSVARAQRALHERRIG